MDDNVLTALEAGASGFLMKQLSPQQLAQAVFTVAGGGTVLAPAVMKQLVSCAAAKKSKSSPELLASVAKLSTREKEVLSLLGEGLSNANISQALHMSESSIKTYVSRMLTKLKLENRIQAALLASNLNLTGNK
jgi:DNA-binding NarL/FixJ family response regulator